MYKNILIAVVPTLFCHAALSQSAMDFAYETQGKGPRPSVIFNDGSNTFIQPTAGSKLSINGARQEGPYLTVSGIPKIITGTANGQALKITHTLERATIKSALYDAEANSSAKLVLLKWAKLAGYELKADFEDYQIAKPITEREFADALLKLALDNPRTQELKSEFSGKLLLITEKSGVKRGEGAGKIAWSRPLPDGGTPGAMQSQSQNANQTAEKSGLPEFKISSDQNLSGVLRAYLSSIGWKLSWDALGEGKSKIRDFKLSEEFAMKPETVTALVETLLRDRGVKVDVWIDDKRVVVSNPEKNEKY